MSYKYSVLLDNPILFYQSNNIYPPELLTYQDVLDNYNTYSALDADYLKYNFIFASSINDISGCDNDGRYTGNIESNHLPLVCGESFSMKIDIDSYIDILADKGYDMQPTVSSFGTKYSSDNDFTLEAWIYPKIVTNNVTPLYADSTSNIGLFYDRGTIFFNLGSESISYTLPYLKTRIYVVAVYTPSNISIYIDGILQASKNILNFKFLNSSLSLQSGPTLDLQDSFLINSIALYRYALDSLKILNHFKNNFELSANNISFPEDGETLELFDNNISMQYRYAYPFNKSWRDFYTEDLYFDPNENSLAILRTSSSTPKTVILEDFITLPSAYVMDSSKIEWDGDNGITVETSIDGTTWETCSNGESIPQYKLSSFSSTYLLYLKITLSTSDASKYIPKINNLYIAFYSDQKKYSNNGSSYVSTFKDLSGISTPEISLGIRKYPILSQDYRNGIRVKSDSGFYVNTAKLIKTLEFFYTPTALTNSGLVNTVSDGGAASNYSWNGSGIVSKSNISAIYIDGVNKTSQTSISNVFQVDKLHHVVIVYSDAISGGIRFSYQTSGTVESLYQNISLYESAFTSTRALDHFELYTLRTPSSALINDTAIQMTENSVESYNNNWTVLQNI